MNQREEMLLGLLKDLITQTISELNALQHDVETGELTFANMHVYIDKAPNFISFFLKHFVKRVAQAIIDAQDMK